MASAEMLAGAGLFETIGLSAAFVLGLTLEAGAGSFSLSGGEAMLTPAGAPVGTYALPAMPGHFPLGGGSAELLKPAHYATPELLPMPFAASSTAELRYSSPAVADVEDTSLALRDAVVVHGDVQGVEPTAVGAPITVTRSSRLRLQWTLDVTTLPAASGMDGDTLLAVFDGSSNEGKQAALSAVLAVLAATATTVTTAADTVFVLLHDGTEFQKITIANLKTVLGV